MRETSRWSELFEQPYPYRQSDTFSQLVGITATGAVLVPVAAPSCRASAACPDAVLAEVTPGGVADAAAVAIASRELAFAPDGTAIALATHADVQVVDAARVPIATLSLAAEQLAPEHVWALAVAPRGDALALEMFDEHGVVIFERAGASYRRAADLPILHSTHLAFDRSGKLLVASGDGVNFVRRTAAAPSELAAPPYPVRDAAFAAEDCAATPRLLECAVDHQLRARLTADASHVIVTAHASRADELARVHDWLAGVRARFHFEAGDVAPGLDLGVVTWGEPGARAVEYHEQARAACPPADRFVRIQERDGWLWRIEVDVPPDTADAVALPLVARFIDGFAGAPPRRAPRVQPAPPSNTQCVTF